LRSNSEGDIRGIASEKHRRSRVHSTARGRALAPDGSLQPILTGGALGATKALSLWERRWRAALTAILALYGWRCLRAPDTYRWLDSLDLAIHETGHLVFAFGGETLTLLGGTLMQLLVPLAFTVALWRQGDRHGATVPLWWLGQNCWNISVYIKDARAQELPLVGGGEHDWALLLGQAGWLAKDQAIGGWVYFVGFVVYAAAIVIGWRALSTPAPALTPSSSPGSPA
jgi:hypothetical protein